MCLLVFMCLFSLLLLSQTNPRATSPGSVSAQLCCCLEDPSCSSSIFKPTCPLASQITSPSGSHSYIWTTARLLLKASKVPVSLQTTLFLHLNLLSSLALHTHTKSQTDLDKGKVCSRARVRTQLCGPRQSCPTVASFLPRHRYQNLKFKEGV